MHWFESKIVEPLKIKSGFMPEINNMDSHIHEFRVKLHLLHTYTNMLELEHFEIIYIKLDITYINNYGVRTRCNQSVEINGFNANMVINKPTKMETLISDIDLKKKD